MEKRREDLMACPSCKVLNAPDSSECYGCGYELIKKTIQLELSKDQARFLQRVLEIFWTSFNKWTPFGKLADEYPGFDLILLADQITRKLEQVLGGKYGHG